MEDSTRSYLQTLISQLCPQDVQPLPILGQQITESLFHSAVQLRHIWISLQIILIVLLLKDFISFETLLTKSTFAVPGRDFHQLRMRLLSCIYFQCLIGLKRGLYGKEYSLLAHSNISIFSAHLQYFQQPTHKHSEQLCSMRVMSCYQIFLSGIF